MEVERDYSTTLQALNARRNAANYYLGIIGEMRQAHTKLKELFLGNGKPPPRRPCAKTTLVQQQKRQGRAWPHPRLNSQQLEFPGHLISTKNKDCKSFAWSIKAR